MLRASLAPNWYRGGMTELPDGLEPAEVPPPVDSALGIVARRAGGEWELLFGMRSRRSRFMPGNLAFPGGKIDPADAPDSAGALERCASRELLEETGLTIPPAAWLDAGERTTPPFFAVRFRTLFFVAEVPADTRPPSPAEIESLSFASAPRVLADWEAGAALVPPPILPILRALIDGRPATAEAIARIVAEVNGAEQPIPRIEFVPGIWALPLRTRTLPPAACTNVWMPGGERFVVVDPGSGEPDEIERLLAVVRKREATGAGVEAVVLTHHHRDHVSGAGAVARALGVPVRAHAATLSRIPPLPPGVRGQALADGETIDLAGALLEAVATPGHAPGHLAFLVSPQRALIAGDLVSGLSTILIGLAEGDMDQYLASLARAASLEPAIVLPAHGPPLPAAAIASTIRHRQEREQRIVAALGSGATRDLASIAEAAYADTPSAAPFLREMQTRSHLERLARTGRVRQHDPSGTSWSA